MMKNNLRSMLNDLYSPIIDKTYKIVSSLTKLHGGFNVVSRFYNGHYHKNSEGSYKEDKYPIPVITISGLCDIEIDFDNICITSKLSKDQIQLLDWNVLKGKHFEVYGLENYLLDYGNEDDIDTMKNDTLASKEKEFFITIYLPTNIPTEDVIELLRLLKNNGFYY